MFWPREKNDNSISLWERIMEMEKYQISRGEKRENMFRPLGKGMFGRDPKNIAKPGHMGFTCFCSFQRCQAFFPGEKRENVSPVFRREFGKMFRIFPWGNLGKCFGDFRRKWGKMLKKSHNGNPLRLYFCMNFQYSLDVCLLFGPDFS